MYKEDLVLNNQQYHKTKPNKTKPFLFSINHLFAYIQMVKQFQMEPNRYNHSRSELTRE